MSGTIFVLQGNRQLVPLNEEPYEAERLLQELLAQYPDLLAGEQISPDAPRRWLLVKREAAIPSVEDGGGRWSVDHLFLDQDGTPTLVEVKRAADTRIRREVIGQLLEYAAHASRYWSAETVQDLLAQRAAEGETVDDLLFGAFGPVNVSAYWEKVAQNLEARHLRLLLVADSIPTELATIVEFLNRSMPDIEVLAVEVRQFVGKEEGQETELKTLVPRVIGQTTQKPIRPPGRNWDEATHLTELALRRPAPEVDVARRLIEWSREEGLSFSWGRGAKDGSFMPVLDAGGASYWCFALWTYARVEIVFQYMSSQPLFAELPARYAFFDRLTKVAAFTSPRNDATLGLRPSIPLSSLTDKAELDKLLTAFHWFFEVARDNELLT